MAGSLTQATSSGAVRTLASSSSLGGAGGLKRAKARCLHNKNDPHRGPPPARRLTDRPFRLLPCKRQAGDEFAGETDRQVCGSCRANVRLHRYNDPGPPGHAALMGGFAYLRRVCIGAGLTGLLRALTPQEA